MWFALARFRLCLVCLLAFCGCASSPEAHFYTLNAAHSMPMDKSTIEQVQYSVAVGPVKVPEIVDRPQFVLRRDGHRVDIVEQHRWAQSLRMEIAGALAEDLGRQLPHARVLLYSDYGARSPDCQVLLDIERFDAILGDTVLVQGLWTVRCGAAVVVKTGRSTVQEPAHGGGFDKLAAAYAQALSTMSVEIAHAIRALQAGR